MRNYRRAAMNTVIAGRYMACSNHPGVNQLVEVLLET